MKISFVALLTFASVSFLSQQVSAENVGGLTDAEFNKLAKTNAFTAMREPRALNFTDADIADSVKRAQAARRDLIVGTIDPKRSYRVVLQVGHFPKIKGATGAQGKLINEQEGSALVVSVLSKKLSELNVDHIVIGAETYKTGLRTVGGQYFKTDIFLSVHLDGSKRPCRVGPSLGYNPKYGKEAMQNLGVAVAIALRLNARDFMRDNYTENLSHFYSYGHADTQIAEGIVELSELSCPPDEKKFLMSADTIAENIATAITFMLGDRK